MRKLSSQFTSLVVIIVMVASMFALVISDFVAKLVFAGYGEEEIMVLGLAFKEILLPIIVIILSWIQIKVYSKSITIPISDLTQATIRISAGDFSTQINSTTKTKEIHTLQENFNMMARELKNNDVLKKDFVSNVSHEFKTPLSAIKGYADLLCKPDTNEADRIRYAATLSSEVDRLSRLTSNMLRMSKLNNQEVVVSPSSFSLDEQIRQAVLLLFNKMNSKNIEIDLDLASSMFVGDEELLSQVWINLLDNAIKYTNDGGKITITMVLKPNHDVVVTVIDNGIGMDEKTRCKIFDQFYQADRSHCKDGNGLGLAIVSRIIRLHGGSINVKSKQDVGSEFRVVLPQRK